MSRPVLSTSRLASRSLASAIRCPRAQRRNLLSLRVSRAGHFTPVHARKFMSTSSALQKGLSPEFENPPVKQAEDSTVTATPAEITEDQYHKLSDEYLEKILSKFEELADEREDVDVEFSAGVLTLTFPAAGTYVINKQPPNKQIWLSSPTSGPKRYDWVVLGDGQNEKQGTAAGDWVYLRDMQTLNDLFIDEIGIDLSMPIPHYGE